MQRPCLVFSNPGTNLTPYTLYLDPKPYAKVTEQIWQVPLWARLPPLHCFEWSLVALGAVLCTFLTPALSTFGSFIYLVKSYASPSPHTLCA